MSKKVVYGGQTYLLTDQHYTRIIDGKEMILCHDDSCNIPLINGKCPVCDIHPDMQSTCLLPVIEY